MYVLSQGRCVSMDTLLLEELQHTLGLLSEARSNIEGNAALLRSVNSDLSAILRRLQARFQQQDDARHISSKSTQGVPRTHAQPQGATQQQEQAQLFFRPTPQLPADFVHLQQHYTSLQEGADHTNSPAGPSLTATAAAGFLHSLDSVYGQQQQQQGLPAGHAGDVLAVQAFADQAYFVGLVAAVLSVVQALTSGGSSGTQASGSTQVSRQDTAQLKHTVPVLLQQCEQWLQAHNPTAQRQQQSSTDITAEQHAEVVRWRNRALRSIAATASTATAAGGHAAGGHAAGQHPGVRPKANPEPTAFASAGTCSKRRQPHGLWLPDHCFDALNRSLAAQPHQPGNSTQSSSRRASWKVLLLQPSVTQQQQQQPVLTYSEVSDVMQYSRQLQKIQQLLLQLAVESQAAPQLLQLLLQCCQQLQQQQAAARRAGSKSSVTHDRCCALYRLLCAMAAGPVKQRGLGTGCQLAVEAELPDDRLPRW